MYEQAHKSRSVVRVSQFQPYVTNVVGLTERQPPSDIWRVSSKTLDGSMLLESEYGTINHEGDCEEAKSKPHSEKIRNHLLLLN